MEWFREYRKKKRQDPEWKAAQAKYQKEYRITNRGELTKKGRTYQQKRAVHIRLVRKGLNPGYESFVENHHGKCDICGREPDGRWKQLNIDHCHKTGKLRGLLCSRCNRAIGYFDDDPRILRAAILYLKKSL
ncbi:MAG: endonuclease VII domain-containing protein [Parcubacteria group bacterium]